MRLEDKIRVAIENAIQHSILKTARLLDKPKTKRFWVTTKRKPKRHYLVYQIEDEEATAFYVVPEAGLLNASYTESSFLRKETEK